MLIELNEKNRANRKDWSWTPQNEKRSADLLSVFTELRQWWPLTERQAYYRLISSIMIGAAHWHVFGKKENGRVDVYNTIGPLLKQMRLDERIPWTALADETRTLTRKPGYDNLEKFIDEELLYFLNGYSRCVAADQPNHIEIWLEKQALLNIVQPIAGEYCRRVMCCKGYNSVTFQADFYNRTEEAKARGLNPVVLYFGDWDPSGTNMFLAAIQTLQEDFGLTGVEYHRCGINPDHFPSLQADPVPLKPTDSRAKAFIKEHGATCYELDALHPLELQRIVRESIEQFTDLDAVSCNFEQQTKDLAFLKDLRPRVKALIKKEIEHA